MSIRAKLNLDESSRIGVGGESEVFALDSDRVVRVMRPGCTTESVTRRRDFLEEISPLAVNVSFEVPRVLDVIEEGDEVATIEARLPGEPMDAVLARTDIDRRTLVRAYLSAAKEITKLTPSGDFYGDLMREENVRTYTFVEYAIARAHQNLRSAGGDYEGLSGLQIASALPDAPRSLVHMDFFPGNVLIEGSAVSAVLDFSVVAIMGDRRIDPIAAAVYLDPEISPNATDEDRTLARTWLEANELLPMMDPVRHWLAAFWAAENDDAALSAWCKRILLQQG